MIDLFKAFSKMDGISYDGGFIAKVKYQQFKPKAHKEIYKNEVVKNNRRLCIIRCSGYIEDEIVETLTVYLMMNVKVKEAVEKQNIQDDWILWRNFSKEKIKEFSHVTGDTNSIHLTENPVVQGLFILKELCESVKSKKIEVKYIHPVYGDNSVYLKHEGNVIKGFSDRALCFQANLLGDSIKM